MRFSKCIQLCKHRYELVFEYTHLPLFPIPNMCPFPVPMPQNHGSAFCLCVYFGMPAFLVPLWKRQIPEVRLSWKSLFVHPPC